MSVIYPICSSSGAAICLWNHLQTAAIGYFCQQSICHKCPAGTYGADGKSCNPCPYATWADLSGTKSCQTSFLFSKPGKQKLFIPYGVSEINVKLWGGGGGGGISNKIAVSSQNIHSSESGGGGGFSSCNISVTPYEYVYIIVAGGGSPSSSKYIDKLGGIYILYL